MFFLGGIKVETPPSPSCVIVYGVASAFFQHQSHMLHVWNIYQHLPHKLAEVTLSSWLPQDAPFIAGLISCGT